MWRPLGVLLPALLLSIYSVQPAQAETEISVIGNVGVTTQSKKVERPYWTEKLSERSKGSIKANFRAREEMGLKGPELVRLLQDGVTQFASVFLGAVSGENAINDAMDLAGQSPSLSELEKTISAFAPVMAQEYEKKYGIKILAYHSFPAQMLFCKNEVRGLEDLKGRNIRSSGASQGDLLKYFGANPIAMSYTEVQQALQKGVVDCAITSAIGGYSAKWYEAAGYLFTLPINWAVSLTAVNIDAWNKLDASTRQTISANVAEMRDAMWALNREEGEIGISCNTGGNCPLGPAGKMTRVDASARDAALLAEALPKAVLPNWAKRCGDDCVAAFNETVGKVTGLTATIP